MALPSSASTAQVHVSRVARCPTCPLKLTSYTGRSLAVAPQAARRSLSRSLRVHAGFGDVAKYLSEAASSIFTTSSSDAPWSGTSTGFQGKVTHHEVARLRSLYNAVKATREKVAGCMDPNAENYDPNATLEDGTCTYLAPEGAPLSEGLRGYISQSLSDLWGKNFEGGTNEPDWEGTGFSYSGDIVSQRDITRLLTYEKMVQETLETAEKQEQAS